jgi:hypothetical protein
MAPCNHYLVEASFPLLKDEAGCIVSTPLRENGRGRRACQGANGGLAGDAPTKALRPIS